MKSFSHEYTLEFSRNYVICHDVTILTDIGKYASIFSCFKFYCFNF